MLYGIALSIDMVLSPSLFSADALPFDGIASGFVIGMIAAFTNGIIAVGYVVARGFMKNDRSFTVSGRNAHYYAAAIGMNVLIFAVKYGVSAHAVPLSGY